MQDHPAGQIFYAPFKRRLYERSGVTEYGDILTTPLLPDLEVPLTQFFDT